MRKNQAPKMKKNNVVGKKGKVISAPGSTRGGETRPDFRGDGEVGKEKRKGGGELDEN